MYKNIKLNCYSESLYLNYSMYTFTFTFTAVILFYYNYVIRYENSILVFRILRLNRNLNVLKLKVNHQ
jgi:hypothetical protein